MHNVAEQQRLDEANRDAAPWRTWGPYLAERQWGTVREDYSPDGHAWDYFPHEAARSRAYRWGEDGIAGISDNQQSLCFALAFWNGQDPILKERLFGLTGPQGNHGESVKEYYYYLDATPTHSYMKMLYKYPQRAFPYERLVEESRRRTVEDPELQLMDTGVFEEDRYFDIFVEYAKAAPDDIVVRVTAHNRGPEAAVLHLLPHLWFRNTWSWDARAERPELSASGSDTVKAEGPGGRFFLRCPDTSALLFTENDTNVHRIFGGEPAEGFFKDAIHEAVVGGRATATNPALRGTKAAAHYIGSIPPGGQQVYRWRLAATRRQDDPAGWDQVVDQRRSEADAFYAALQGRVADEDARAIQRQAYAGMLWTKQYYHYDVRDWLHGDPNQPPPPPERKHGRNREWGHLNNADIISMPDTWEYPWYAAWDLAFHCLPLARLDPEFAKHQLLLLTREWYMHPNGQLPAYEWALGDVNPPVHAWATWRVYKIDRRSRGGDGDIAFLEKVFQKLLLNFTWWVNRKDHDGNNIFQGGFLGLDNIGVFDRSADLPTGGHIEQADGTSWMAMYCLHMMRIALELAAHKPVYEDMATKFLEHFLYIAEAMMNMGGEGLSLWDEEDEFYYDVLHTPDGSHHTLRLRSMVGLIPLFAVETLEPELLAHVPEFARRLEWFLDYRPDLASLVSRWQEPGSGERRLLSLLRGHRMKRLLHRMLDETEFLSDYGVRALSRHYLDSPFVFKADGSHFTVTYQPGESDTDLFGGNSNWRGPVWFPVNVLIIESLQKFHHYYGDDFRVECPTGSGNMLTILEVADELSRRLCRIFLRDEKGHRPLYGYHERLGTDPHFRDHILFHEYFHGDEGWGLGASHQTGWTGLVAKLLEQRSG